MLDREVYCNVPYASVMINPDGSYRLCCLTNGKEFDMGGCKDIESGVEMNIFTHSFDDALSSKWHSYLRDQHKLGVKSSMCACCYDRDRIEGNSRREHMNWMLPAGVPDYPRPSTSEALTVDGKFTGRVRALDLRFGNLCNRKCITCGPWYSDKWYDEYREFNKIQFFPWNGKIIPLVGKRLGEGPDGVPWWESDIWWKRFDEQIPYLRHIYFTGGEPLIIKSYTTMLERMVDAGTAKDVIIELDTNLSVINPKIIGLWRHFKKVDLRVSIDDVEDGYEVFRFPGLWADFDKNLRTLKEEGFDAILTSCITPVNVFRIAKIEDYVASLGVSHPAHFRFVDTPAYLDLRVFNDAQRLRMLESLSATAAGHIWPAKVMSYLKAASPAAQNVAHAKKFFKFMDYLDVSRGHKWRDVYPEASALEEL